MKYANFFTLFVAFLITKTGNAEAITLKEALEKAYENSETVEMKEKLRDFGDINRDTAILALLPTVQLDWQSQKILSKPKLFSMPSNVQPTTPMETALVKNLSSGGNKKPWMTVLSVNVKSSLSIYKTWPGVYIASKGKDAKDYEYKGFLEDFGLLFIQKYMDIIYNESAAKVYEQMSDTFEKKMKKISVMNKYGSAKSDQVVLAEAQFYRNKADVISTKSALDKAKMEYKIMTGEDPIDLQMPDVMNAQLPAKDKEDFVNLALSKNSKLLQAENEATSQKYYAMVQAFDMLPEVYTEFSYVKYKSKGFLNMNYSYMGFGATWAINDKLNRFNTARKEYKNYRIADLNYNLTKKQTEQDAAYAWDQYFSMKDLVVATKKALDASKNSLKEIKVSVATGTASFVDEMDVETRYLNSNLDYLNAKKALILAYYRIVSMTGVGYLPVE